MSRGKKLDDLMEAIAFAEAGETETAGRIASEIFPVDRGPEQGERILTVSTAAGFSPVLVEKSVGMAERLEYGLVALSVPPAPARWVQRLRGRRDGEGGVPAEVFRARAAERGIPFTYAARRGDPEKAVEEVRRRFRRIAFLLVEPELAPRVRLAGVNLPIFLVADR